MCKDDIEPIYSAAVGDDFFEDDPAYPVTKLFVEVKQMRQKQARAKELLASKGYLDIAEKVKEVEDFGYLEATKRKSGRRQSTRPAHFNSQRLPHGQCVRPTSPTSSSTSSPSWHT